MLFDDCRFPQGDYVWWVPNSLIGLLAVAAGFVTLLLPETRGKTLPDTIEEAELFGINKPLEIDNVSNEKPDESIEKETKLFSIHL